MGVTPYFQAIPEDCNLFRCLQKDRRLGLVMGSGAAGVGVEARAGIEWQMSRHLGAMFELQGVTGNAGEPRIGTSTAQTPPSSAD